MQEALEDIPIGLKSLMRDLDELAGASNGPRVDDLPDLAGTDFQNVKFLRRGGMGEVYEAIQLSLDRPVALKLLPQSVVHDAGAQARFMAEAQTVARLHHPNIIQTIAAGVAHGRPYFSMELMTTPPVSEHVFTTVEELVRFGLSLAAALVYVHSCGVVHRDVKPSNVFLGTDGTARLADFGLACLGDAIPCEKSGTRRYMAPELRNDGTASALSDQYAFGATMLELSAPIADVRTNADLMAILAKTTAEDPHARYATMAEVADDLNRFLRHEPVTARPAGLIHNLQLGARRNPAAAIALGLTGIFLVALIVSLAVGYWRTARALAETERARAETTAALEQVENEAGQAAQALATTLTTIDRTSKDVRANEIERAIATVKVLAERFPGNQEIKAALDRLEYARVAHAKLKAQRGMNLLHPARTPPDRK